MLEFLIKRTDGDGFDLHASKFPEVLRPSSFASRPIEGWGDHRIQVLDSEGSFSTEDPGIQVCFESGRITPVQAEQVVKEVLERIVRSTGQQGQALRIT